MKSKIILAIALVVTSIAGTTEACSKSESGNSNDSIVCEQIKVIDQQPVLVVDSFPTKDCNVLRLKPDLSRLHMDMMCGGVPDAWNDSLILIFAGPFTGTVDGKGHINIAGDHVMGGKRFKGYRCKRNTGAFTWSAKSGPQFFYRDYSSAFDKAAEEEGMGFAQEMIIHDGEAVKTTRPLGNKNQFRALCLDSDGTLALYESRSMLTFGNFIDALLSRGVKEALYTDTGLGWDYCFYRTDKDQANPEYLHSVPLPYASNFIIIKTTK